MTDSIGNKLLKFSPLALAIALINPAAASTPQFDQTVFFGDSLSDTGRIKDIVSGNFFIGSFANAMQPSFTTNPDPAWTRVFAEHYGTAANPYTSSDTQGTNYAVGGAKVSETAEQFGGLVRIPSVNRQISDYLNNTNNTTNPNALYTIWVGANDLLAASTTPDIAAAAATISQAAQNQAAQVVRLQQAGANYILVPNLPDVGLTPRNVGDARQAATATTAANLYNKTLYSNLNQGTANVIAANTFALLQEAVRDKEAFGFKNTTNIACDGALSSLTCTASDWQAVAADANDTYMFADDIHPAGRTHRILAQYFASIIDSPAQIAQLPTALIKDGKSANAQLNRRLSNLDNPRHSVWADVTASGDNKPNAIIGLDVAGDNQHTGAYIQHQRQDYTLGKTTTADSRQTGAGVYHRRDFGNARLTAAAGIDRLSLQTDRKIAWDGAARSHQAETTGSRSYASVQGGYGINTGKITYRPYIGVLAQTLKVNALTENQPKLSTALSFDTQKQKSLQGEIGLNLTAAINDKTELFGGVGYQREFNDDLRTITTTVSSIADYRRGFALPVQNDKTSATIAHAGAKFRLGAATNLSIGANAIRQDGDTDVGGFVGLQSKF
ncbi:outer membrane lipase/esterase [Moraxella cuniculi DSM 21768]|uniref:Outer membrane lipase/esterase n=1 Tax=Moraxella cuniculi DSM 21768 TaxID=1122245 RepID=A0A1N7F2Y2_9GAMM|nr:autotransporter domain-containing protein [Moraxella cuniculi]OOS05030.1 hypothetical protein B0189_07635 [Moraxella cuniculi]SIR94644.1 outer membrane lipase/esterase [Moraxella cuniculi DSM 21768]